MERAQRTFEMRMSREKFLVDPNDLSLCPSELGCPSFVLDDESFEALKSYLTISLWLLCYLTKHSQIRDML